MKQTLKTTLLKNADNMLNNEFSNTNKKPKRKKPFLLGNKIWAVVFMAPSIIGTAVFFLFPFLDTIRRSLYNTKGNIFTGLDAYRQVLTNDAFKLAAKNTLKFTVACIPLLIILSLILALLIKAVQKKGKDGRLYKTLLLMPMALPVASIVLLWQVLFYPKGIADTAITSIGLNSIDFINSETVFFVLVFTYLWKNTGYDMILWLAGLDGISASLYEAAAVDGAGRWKTFFHISLPCTLPSLGLISILSLLNSFKVFREAYLVAGAYPNDSIYLLQHLFNNWFSQLDISRLCAAAVLLCIFLLALILPMQKFLKAENYE